MKKKKVLRILNRFNVGGPIYNATYLTKYLDKNNYETLLVGGKWENHENDGTYILKNEGVNYKIISSMKRKISLINDFVSLLFIIKIIYKFKPDIIHTHAAKAGLLGRLASFFYVGKVKVIHTYHGNVFEGYFSSFFTKIILYIEKFLSLKTNKIIAISDLQKNDLSNKYNIAKQKKIRVIRLGFDLEKFSNNNSFKRKKIRDNYKLKNNDIMITIIGRVVPVKNHKFFIDVFKKCKQKTKKNIKAFVIGDGDEISNVINYTSKKGLIFNYKYLKVSEYDVFFCSWKKNIDEFLAASDIVALTSVNEGTPVSIIESMASGTASISTNVGGVSDIIKNNISGVVSSNSVNSYSNHLLKLIDDDNFRNNLAKEGKKIYKLYDYKVLVKNIENLYDEILNK